MAEQRFRCAAPTLGGRPCLRPVSRHDVFCHQHATFMDPSRPGAPKDYAYEMIQWWNNNQRGQRDEKFNYWKFPSLSVPEIPSKLAEAIRYAQGQRLQTATEKERHILFDYTGLGYGTVNGYLRSNHKDAYSEKDREKVMSLDRAFRNLHITLPFDIVSYRCLSGIYGATVQQILEDKAYKSTSLHPDFAHDFCKGKSNVQNHVALLKIRVCAGTPFIYYYGRQEAEVLLHHTCKLRYMSSQLWTHVPYIARAEDIRGEFDPGLTEEEIVRQEQRLINSTFRLIEVETEP